MIVFFKKGIMTFIDTLHKNLEKWHLLKHPFYQAWNEGSLSQDTLIDYAKEYYHHVKAFPRYLSQIHTLCDDLPSRQVLLHNLVDEESGEKNHPELWMQFLEGLAQHRLVDAHPVKKSTQRLVHGFFKLVKKDYATGLGALYAYERQTPSVAESKMKGLKEHYGIEDSKTVEFFDVHKGADVWHTQELVGLIEKLDTPAKQRVYDGAKNGAKLLWGFLDGMMESQPHACCPVH
jgi:pyrroloquinoline-quinone synthase